MRLLLSKMQDNSTTSCGKYVKIDVLLREGCAIWCILYCKENTMLKKADIFLLSSYLAIPNLLLLTRIGMLYFVHTDKILRERWGRCCDSWVGDGWSQIRRLQQSVNLLLFIPATLYPKSIYVFPEMKLRGLVSNSYIYVSVSNLNIPRIGLSIWLQQNRQTNPGNI
jgi:hypothetical protein